MQKSIEMVQEWKEHEKDKEDERECETQAVLSVGTLRPLDTIPNVPT